MTVEKDKAKKELMSALGFIALAFAIVKPHAASSLVATLQQIQQLN